MTLASKYRFMTLASKDIHSTYCIIQNISLSSFP